MAVSIRESGSSPQLPFSASPCWSLYSSFRRRRRGTGELELAQGRWAHTCSDRRGARRGVGLVLGWRASIPFGGQSSLKTVRETLEDPSRIDIWGSAIEPSLKALFTLGLLTLPATVIVSLRGPFAGLPEHDRHWQRLPALWRWSRPSWPGVADQSATTSLKRWDQAFHSDRPTTGSRILAWAAIAAFSAYSCFVIVLCAVGALVRLIGEHGAARGTELAPRTPAHGRRHNVLASHRRIDVRRRAVRPADLRPPSPADSSLRCGLRHGGGRTSSDCTATIHAHGVLGPGRVRSTRACLFDERRCLRRRPLASSVGPRRSRYRSVEDRRWSGLGRLPLRRAAASRTRTNPQDSGGHRATTISGRASSSCPAGGGWEISIVRGQFADGRQHCRSAAT